VSIHWSSRTISNLGIRTVKKQRKWTSWVYAHFSPKVRIQYINGKTVQCFTCLGTKCGGKTIRRYPSDKGSTSNLVNHVTSCWGSAVQEAAKRAVDEQKMSVDETREKVVHPYLKTGKITQHFDHVSVSVTYSNIPHSDEEKR
jgi:hypothetical protein